MPIIAFGDVVRTKKVPYILHSFRHRPTSPSNTPTCQVTAQFYQVTAQLADSTQWIPEISHHAPGVPLILVGTKLDLREDPVTLQRLKERRFAPVTYAMGMGCAREVGAVKYLEASSKT